MLLRGVRVTITSRFQGLGCGPLARVRRDRVKKRQWRESEKETQSGSKLERGAKQQRAQGKTATNDHEDLGATERWPW